MSKDRPPFHHPARLPACLERDGWWLAPQDPTARGSAEIIPFPKRPAKPRQDVVVLFPVHLLPRRDQSR